MRNPSALSLVFGHFMVFICLLAAPAVPAQEVKPQPPGVAQASVSESDLQAFAKAYIDYHRIRRTYETRIRKAENAKEKDKIQKEGNAKVKQALEKQRLTTQSYNQLFTAVNGNETLRQKALKFIDQERTKS